MSAKIEISMEAIEAFCRKWKVTEFALFGSVLRDDFGPDSDIDVLVSLAPDARWRLSDLFDARDELESLLGRRVDLLTRRSVQLHHNPWLRHEILSGARTVYQTA